MVVMNVDDSLSMRKIVTLALKGAGYTVLEADNGEDALSKLTASPVDLFIVDINMPVMNGIDFIKKIKSNPSYASKPIIILTTEFEEDKKKEGLALGANDWILKPFQKEKLLETIKKLS
ncbi:MAG TPA: two-component system response regulator [Spirochaetia bacterium]|nr:MAG: two-component system response regulator [Spirochaetes bacterium GWB1_36_13]HCL57286.1 two-component system response regulator [Spirochaetia bacterium]